MDRTKLAKIRIDYRNELNFCFVLTLRLLRIFLIFQLMTHQLVYIQLDLKAVVYQLERHLVDIGVASFHQKQFPKGFL